MTRSALGAADRLACGRRSLTGTGLAQQGTGFAQTLNCNRYGLPMLGRRRRDPTHWISPDNLLEGGNEAT
ncbi:MULTISPECIES: hypothetical protein [Sphingomonadaceae]|jgi:hypothetical protein|uniref:hypothetical protein n=1 Tax=Sphingomonadales TaxID=204457 RepID=UPI000248A3C8|nr:MULTISPECIES: hypothetical protein [Sphingomonadaceae]